MEKPVTISRRDFTLKSALAVLAGATITITACDSDSPTTPTNGSDRGPGGETGSVSSNHSHVAQVTAAQLTAGSAISLAIQGSAPHTHTIELTMDDVQRIGTGTRVSKESSVTSSVTYGTHSHTVSFN